MDAATFWLACYVMISRARTIEGFLVLRPATRKELSAKPPQYIVNEISRLLDLEKSSLSELRNYIRKVSRSGVRVSQAGLGLYGGFVRFLRCNRRANFRIGKLYISDWVGSVVDAFAWQPMTLTRHARQG